jgi:hypothetical protein
LLLKQYVSLRSKGRHNYQNIVEKDFIYYNIIAIKWGKSTHFLRPLNQNGPLQAGTVDEIKATMEGLRLSPTAVVGYFINDFMRLRQQWKV